MKPYAIRRSPTGYGWVMYGLDCAGDRPIYRILGWALTMPIAIDGLTDTPLGPGGVFG